MIKFHILSSPKQHQTIKMEFDDTDNSIKTPVTETHIDINANNTTPPNIYNNTDPNDKFLSDDSNTETSKNMVRNPSAEMSLKSNIELDSGMRRTGTLNTDFNRTKSTIQWLYL